MLQSTFFLICWVGTAWLFSRFYQISQCEYVLGERQERCVWPVAVVAFLPVFLQAAFRGDVGDTYAYKQMYKELPETFFGLLEMLPTVTKDAGFTALSGLIKLLLGGNTTVFLFVIALIQSIFLVVVYRKYSTDYLMSIFLFVASTDYLSWMFNGMRQFVAVTLIFGATTLLLEKKWPWVIAVILLASTMHQSALLMIPVVFMVQGKAWNRWSVLFLGLALVAVMFVDRFTNILDDMMQETQYANMVTDWNEWGDDGTNVFRVLVYSVPTVLSLVGLRYIRAENDPVINLCANMSIVSTGLYIISMFTSGIFIGRLPIYASLYNYILLPWEISRMFEEKSQKLVNGIMVACYLVFCWYQMSVAWG